MPQVSRNALVPFSCRQMYELVNAVESYSSFLPHCKGTEIIERTNDSVIAKVLVGQAGLIQSFTTCNQLTPYSKIQMTLIDGPFDYLNGVWQFKPLSEHACKVELDLDFKFKNQLFAMAFGKVFNGMAESMVKTFIEKAKREYGGVL